MMKGAGKDRETVAGHLSIGIRILIVIPSYVGTLGSRHTCTYTYCNQWLTPDVVISF